MVVLIEKILIYVLKEHIGTRWKRTSAFTGQAAQYITNIAAHPETPRRTGSPPSRG